MTTAQVVQPQRPARIEQERAQRRRREDIGIGRLRNLAVDESKLDPDYVYRWINDDPGRVQSLTVRDDWDVVTTEALGERDAKDKGVGSNVERVVDKVTGKRAVLVRKPRDYYYADKAKEQGLIDEMDAALKRGESRAEGSLQAMEPSKAYVPRGGISIQDGRRG